MRALEGLDGRRRARSEVAIGGDAERLLECDHLRAVGDGVGQLQRRGHVRDRRGGVGCGVRRSVCRRRGGTLVGVLGCGESIPRLAADDPVDGEAVRRLEGADRGARDGADDAIDADAEHALGIANVAEDDFAVDASLDRRDRVGLDDRRGARGAHGARVGLRGPRGDGREDALGGRGVVHDAASGRRAVAAPAGVRAVLTGAGPGRGVRAAGERGEGRGREQREHGGAADGGAGEGRAGAGGAARTPVDDGLAERALVGEVPLRAQAAQLERRAARASPARERALQRLRPKIGASQITCELHGRPSWFLRQIEPAGLADGLALCATSPDGNDSPHRPQGSPDWVPRSPATECSTIRLPLCARRG